jgi:probable HAF family extracellular repeat protein
MLRTRWLTVGEPRSLAFFRLIAVTGMVVACADHPTDVKPVDSTDTGAATSYSVVAITAPGVVLTPVGLSSDGRVAGTATLPSGETHAFAWTSGVYRDLGLYNGARTGAVGINSSGDVAGYARRSDSSYVALVWHADGRIDVVADGRPVPIGITDDGGVETNGLASGSYWQNGRIVRVDAGPVLALANSGIVMHLSPSDEYPQCYLEHPDGRTTVLNAGHVTTCRVINDLGDAFLTLNVFGSTSPSDYLYSHTDTSTYSAVPTAASAIWPERVPKDYQPPEYESAVDSLTPIALNDSLSYLTTTTVVTTHGAYAIEPQIADASWALVRAVTMNDAGRILVIGRNRSSGTVTALLLVPR